LATVQENNEMVRMEAIRKYMSGIRRYGLSRAIAGMIAYLRYTALKPKGGSISTFTDGLYIHFVYPAQFIATVVIFKEPVEPEYEFLRHVLANDSVFFDVGGGIGCYTVFSAKLVNGPIHTFEPVEENILTIEKNLDANRVASKVVLNQLALSNKKGFCRIQKAADLFSGRVADLSSQHRNGYIEVTTLDSYCLQRNIDHIDVLKIDVEGHEREVIEGGKQLLIDKKIRIIILECNPELAQFYESLEDMGFEYFYYDPRKNSLRHILPLCERTIRELKPSAFHSNLVLIQHETMDRLPHKLKTAT
jgi:FkbM family methyltransferase